MRKVKIPHQYLSDKHHLSEAARNFAIMLSKSPIAILYQPRIEEACLRGPKVLGRLAPSQKALELAFGLAGVHYESDIDRMLFSRESIERFNQWHFSISPTYLLRTIYYTADPSEVTPLK